MQKIYTLQVKNRSENKYIRLFKLQYPQLPFTLYAPLRRMPIRRKGLVKQSTTVVFPGYVFVETGEDDDFNANKTAFRRIAGFYRILRSNQNICPLSGRDLELALHFIRKAGPVAGASSVFFNEQSRIVIVDGPLLGLEGKIVKVDRRKGRAKIKLNLYDDSFSIDLPFTVIEQTDNFGDKNAC